MVNYNVSQRENSPDYNPTESGKIGRGVGTTFGNLAKAGMEYNRSAINDEKVRSLLDDYNNNKGAFGVTEGEGAVPSFKTKRLAQLLLPLDPTLAAKYEVRASEQGKSESTAKVDKDISDAYNAPSEYEDPGADVATGVQNEINMIEEELKSRSRRGNMVEDSSVSMIPPVTPVRSYQRYVAPADPGVQ
jgi:hypothetical protein